MFKVRQIKYAEGSTSVQVYKIENRKRVIVRHIGTAKTDEEKSHLLDLADDFIKKVSKQFSMFEDVKTDGFLYLNQTEYIGIYYTFLNELLSKIFIHIGFDKLKQILLLDLVLMRMVESASKLRSIELLEQYFGIRHRRQKYYETAPIWLGLKDKTERITLAFAQKHYDFNYDLLFYDVTTLYFETFEEDGLRKNGFSKDNKSQQPQILVALMVSKEGFPIAYEIFAGNTFEGKTIIPVVQKFIQKNKVKNFTIVADAAMISDENVKQLVQENINYIVGARLGNVSEELLRTIDQKLERQDGKNTRIQTPKGDLICSFSSLRYRKDKYEMERQLEAAKSVVKAPSKSKRLKFTKTEGQLISLNEALIEKTTKLLGIKGYYTNLDEVVASNNTIIERYHELYRIEQAFRISKHDLQTRPIFHFKEDPIQLHMLICFMALVTSKHIELQTGISINKFIRECKKITDARLKNKLTGKEYRLRSQITPEMENYIQKLNC